MCEIKADPNTGFYTVNGNFIEGYIGDSKKAEILFILREPNTNGKLTQEFWFKDVVKGKEPNYKEWKLNDIRKNKIARTKYLNTYAKIANKLLNNNDDNISTVLNNCAYINLYPFSGENSCSGNYKCVKNNLINDEREINHSICMLIENRLKIIDNLIEEGCKYVVTVNDIFYALKEHYEKAEKIIIKTELSSLRRKNNRGNFEKFVYNGATFMNFYHPSYCFKYEEVFPKVEFNRDTE